MPADAWYGSVLLAAVLALLIGAVKLALVALWSAFRAFSLVMHTLFRGLTDWSRFAMGPGLLHLPVACALGALVARLSGALVLALLVLDRDDELAGKEDAEPPVMVGVADGVASTPRAARMSRRLLGEIARAYRQGKAALQLVAIAGYCASLCLASHPTDHTPGAVQLPLLG